MNSINATAAARDAEKMTDRAKKIKGFATTNGWTPGMVMLYALCVGVKGILVKTFKNGQELREYTIDGWHGKIRAYPVEHSA